LRERLPSPQATREFVRVLRLHEDYPEPLIAQALQQALEEYCYGADGVRQILLRLAEPSAALSLLQERPLPVPDVAPVAWPAVSQFDRLLPSLAGGVP
jgi:hypothetical protein